MEIVYLLKKAVSTTESLQKSPPVTVLFSLATKSYYLMHSNILEASMFVPKCWTLHMKIILVKMR